MRYKDEAEDRILRLTVAPLPGVEKPVRRLRKNYISMAVTTRSGNGNYHHDPLFGLSISNRVLLWVTHSLRIRIRTLLVEW